MRRIGMQGNLADYRLEHFAGDEHFPNSVLPAVIYRGAVPEASAEALEALFDSNGWPSQWRAGVYNSRDYHSPAHDCLGVARGAATTRLGGPGGRDFSLRAGHVVVLPARTSHCRLTQNPDFLVIG